MIILSGLTSGEYFLRIKPLKKNITIRVIDNSKRWLESDSILIAKSIFYDTNEGAKKQIDPV